jgi:hypothetical protein
MRTSVILFATDLIDEGFETVVDRIRDMAGADCITMAANYHHSRDVFPHNPRRKVRFMRGGVFFRADPARYAGLRIQPDVADIAREDDPLARLIDVAGKRGMTVKAWTNGVHSTVHASANQDCAVHNAFGDPYITTLCPTNPDVRAYLRALAGDLGRYDLEAYLAESVCFMPFDHGYHHERTLVPISATVKYLLSLCFCPHCVRAAAARGVAVTALQTFVRDETEQALNGAPSAVDGVPLTRDAVAALAGGEMAGLLAAREDTIASLIGELVEASGTVPLHVMEWSGGLRAVGGGMEVGGISGTVCDRAWQDGVDIPRVAGQCRGLSVLGYVRDPAVLRAEIGDYRAILPPGLPLSVAVRPMPPDCASAADVAGQLRALHDAGAAAADYYHYGFMRLSNLGWIGEARKLLAREDRP